MSLLGTARLSWVAEVLPPGGHGGAESSWDGAFVLLDAKREVPW